MRLIDADYTLKQYEEYCKNNCKYTKREQEVMCRACPTGDAVEMLEDAPTVDAIPRSEVEEIKAEIKEKYGDAEICEWFEDFDYDENDISEYRSIGSINDILCIINKHTSGKEHMEVSATE